MRKLASIPSMVFFRALSGLLAVVCLLLVLWAPASRANPDIIRVAATGNDVSGCGSETEPCATIQYAADQALSGDEIHVAQGIYIGVSLRGGTRQVVYLNKPLMIRGGYSTTNWNTANPNASLTTLNAQNKGRVLYIDAGTNVTVEGLTLSGGQASTGGGVYVHDSTSTLVLTNTVITGNTADDQGGGLFNNRGTVRINNSDITSNSASSGGGLFNNIIGTLTLNGSTVSGNSAGSGGGIRNVGGTTALNASNVSNNMANFNTTGGGGIFNSNIGDLILSNSIVENNNASLGGGILSQDSSVTINSSTLRNNSSSLSGGGLRNDRGTIELTDSSIQGNSATQGGGGLHTVDGTLLLTDSSVGDNTANIGGGIDNQSSGVTVVSSTVSSNISTISGGGIANRGSEVSLELTDSTISSNEANGTAQVDGGGAIWNVGGIVTVSSSQVVSNTTANNGGGIWNVDGTVTVSNSQIYSNTSSSDGGGIFNRTNSSTGQAELMVNNSTVNGNQATSGGGIRNIGGAMTLIDNTFARNRADNGGALFNGGNLEIVISGSTVNSNTVTNQGGGIFNSDGMLTLNSSTLSNNQARAGGGLFNQSGNIMLNNSTAAYNMATDEGGGLLNRDGMVALRNIIVAYSSGGDCAGTLLSEGYNMDTDSTCGLTAPGDQMETDPQLGPLQDNGGPTFTHALLPGSRAIDGGVCGAIITDQRGEPRPGFGSSFCDVGAFERQSVSADLSISKYVDPVGTLVPGQPITYTLVYTNVGVARGGEIVIDDVLPDTLSNFSYTSSGPEVVETGSTPYRWQIDDLGPMDQGIITITARIRPDLASRTSFVNRARINSLTIVDVMPENNFSSVENRVLLPRVAFSSADYIVEEATAQAVITVTLDPVPQVPVRVDYATRDSIAIAPDDYTATSGTLAFNAGQRVGTFVIPINRDTNLESAETVRLILNNPVNAEIGIPSTATLTIINSAVQRLYMPLAVTP